MVGHVGPESGSRRRKLAHRWHADVSGTPRAESKLGRSLRRVARGAPFQPLGRRLGARWRPSVRGAETLQRSATDSISRQPLARPRWTDHGRPFDADGSNPPAALLRIPRPYWNH